MEKVMIKSKFYGWQEVSKETVIEYAKWKILAITTCKDNEERLELVNNSIKGMKVSLDEIL